jgi:hypothetical protein
MKYWRVRKARTVALIPVEGKIFSEKDTTSCTRYDNKNCPSRKKGICFGDYKGWCVSSGVKEGYYEPVSRDSIKLARVLEEEQDA